MSGDAPQYYRGERGDSAAWANALAAIDALEAHLEMLVDSKEGLPPEKRAEIEKRLELIRAKLWNQVDQKK